jgi:hypothetical protein
VRPETFRRGISWSDYNDATLPIRPGIVVAQSIELWLNIRIDLWAWIDAGRQVLKVKALFFRPPVTVLGTDGKEAFTLGL